MVSLKTENKNPSYIIHEEELTNTSLEKNALLYLIIWKQVLKRAKERTMIRKEGGRGEVREETKEERRKINLSFFSPSPKSFRLVVYFPLQDILPCLSVFMYNQPQEQNTH